VLFVSVFILYSLLQVILENKGLYNIAVDQLTLCALFTRWQAFCVTHVIASWKYANGIGLIQGLVAFATVLFQFAIAYEQTTLF